MPLEIHLDNGRCKVIEGKARRTYYSSEEAVGLALLRMTGSGAGSGADVKWVDCLAKRGIAVGLAGNRALTLQVTPGRERTFRWRRNADHPSKEYKATFPSTLMALSVVDGKLVKSQLWLIKPGLEDKLTATLTEGTLTYFPYGNVYNHGGICWGTANLRGLSHPQDIEDAFFNSDFNSDLCYPAHFGRTEATLPDLITAGAGVLPIPPLSSYTGSIAGAVRQLLA